jgi:hypothetical protein
LHDATESSAPNKWCYQYQKDIASESFNNSYCELEAARNSVAPFARDFVTGKFWCYWKLSVSRKSAILATCTVSLLVSVLFLRNFKFLGLNWQPKVSAESEMVPFKN